MDEIGNLNVIKQLVGSDNGISFLYEAAAQQALEDNTIVELEIRGWSAMREFNFVFSLDSQTERVERNHQKGSSPERVQGT